jgi:hypothetical protein
VCLLAYLLAFLLVFLVDNGKERVACMYLNHFDPLSSGEYSYCTVGRDEDDRQVGNLLIAT